MANDTNKKTTAAMKGKDVGTIDKGSVVAEDTAKNYGQQEDDDLVWYFSYGSNLNPEIFEKKRKIKCVDYRLCKAPGYVLTFTESMIPYCEPSFCTCVKRSDLPCHQSNIRPDIHGVAFLITRQQYEHMLLTEGGWGYQEYRSCPFWGIGHYGEEEIECVEIEPERCCDGDNNNKDPPVSTTTTTSTEVPPQRFKALTLTGLFGNHQRYDANCSKRYYDIVQAGAASSGLPTSYRDYLRERHPAYEPSGCWRSTLAFRLYFVFAFPCLVVELGTVHLCIWWNERKLAQQKMANDKTEGESSKQTKIETRRKRFEDVARPPWILMKLCQLYQITVLETIVTPFLTDWCKLPDGYRNSCCGDAANDSRKDTADKKPQ